MQTLNTTILFIKKDGKVLLGQKKRGFAIGTISGIGGKQDPGETIEETMIRETQEEIGVTPTKYKNMGMITFDTYYKGIHTLMNMSIFTCSEFLGNINETDEIKPVWYDKENLPYDRMFDDDLLWINDVLNDKKVSGGVVLNEKLEMQSNNLKIEK